jgi:hypothetical protein
MWTFEHSVECKADRRFAWQFWTNVGNWAVVDSSVESVSLDGPFRSGAKGHTKPLGRELIEWHLDDAQDERSAVFIIPVPGAALQFAWRFEDSETGGTRMTQRATLEGDRAQDYILTVARELEYGIPQGMQKLAQAIEQAAVGSALGRWLCPF